MLSNTVRTTTLQVEGTFDVPAAKRVVGVLDRAQAGESVVVDLSRVREFHDFGVAVLAQAVKQCARARVALLGLRHHQARLMRYLGVDADRYCAAQERP